MSFQDETLSPDLEESARILDRYTRDRFRIHQDLVGERLLDRLEKNEPSFSIARVITSLAGGGLHRKDRAYLEKVSERNGVDFDPLKPFIEFRDLTAASASAGGFLVETQVKEPVDILRPWSVTARAGVQVEMGLVGNVAIPKVSQKTTPAWIPTEGTQVSPSQPTLSQIALTPKTVGVVVQFSRQLNLQAHADKFVGREFLRTTGTAFDQAVINGSGVSGQPLGLLSTAGVQTQSGTTLNSGVNTMKQKSAEANVNDENMAFLSTPAVRTLLEGRERATGGGRFVWDQDKVADRRAFVTTDMPAATMICGDWSLIYLGIWGKGFVLEINPYDQSGFKSGLIQARMLVSCDLAVLHPSSFIFASGIS